MKKRISILLMICVMGSAFAFAQRRGNQRAPKRDRIHKVISPEERAKNRTERMTFDYVLTEKQAEKVLKLNEEWTKKTQEQFEKYKLTNKEENNQRATRYRDLSEADREKFQNDRKKLFDDYDAEIKKIFSKEQYAKYTQRKESRFEGKRGCEYCDGEGYKRNSPRSKRSPRR